jgi:hypothetical protein
MDNHTKRKCGGIYLPSQVEPQSKLQMAQPAIRTMPSCRWENDKHAAACSSKPGGYGKPHQEFRVILHLLLLRLEHLNGDNDKDEEMSGLQELKKGGKRTILS